MKQLSERQVFAMFDLLPLELAAITNLLGQSVRFLEHPTLGDSSPVLVHIEENGVNYVCISDFYETTDMAEVEDYQPLLVEGKIISFYEAPESLLINNNKLDYDS